ncbi:hypothetical protein BO71DRAFT_397020 [Aspergillus ellipticus CBS 707.79]|uniref:Uncharacterized protein n=1 Tax=Aspergillus ellipticus CBS 707.79 TaxID=1448320 RepID=A0A319DGI6_9EURO|nr:hypothetical protein BO71DRAFT_397020 [Aspergillus ellipticus CBS 707.79]
MTLTYGSTPLSDHNSWALATTTLTTDSTVGAIDIVGWEIKYPVTATATGTATSTARSATVTATSTSTTLPSSIKDEASASGNGLTTAGVGAVGIIALLLAIYFLRQRQRLIMRSQQPVTAYQYYPPTQRNSRPTELPGFQGMPGDAWGSSPVEMETRY